MVGSLNQWEQLEGTSDDVTLVTGKGLVKKVTINAVGSDWNIILYDDTGTGTSRKIADITPANTTTLEYNVRLANGLRVVTSGTTAGSATILFEGE